MSLRLRLAICYGTLFALILPLVTLFSYALHARGQYDDLDRTLVVSAGHAAAEAATLPTGPHLLQGRSDLEIALRVYHSNGQLQERSLGTEALPSVDPQHILKRPTGPAFDSVTAFVTSLMGSSPVATDGGAFGIVSTKEQRWRLYILPIQQAGATHGYIEAVTPLGRLDSSLHAFQLLLPIIGLASLVLALGGSWAIAGNALRPIARMIQTAQAIALSRDLSRRIDVPSHQDELYRLATTFNDLLVSLEKSYATQQRFVSDASHELRAPLTALQGNLELLRRHHAMSEMDREVAFSEMEREASRLTRLVADLLMLARADAGIALQFCPVDLDAVALEVFRSARQLAHGQKLVLAPFEPLRVEGDEDRIKQLLLILLDNALKYTPSDGQVTLGIRQDATMAEILVQDSGIGISAQDLPHIFERFYRADPARGRDPGGTGLGLSIAQWIVAQHHGEIIAESQPGKGTTMHVRLPLCLCP